MDEIPSPSASVDDDLSLVERLRRRGACLLPASETPLLRIKPQKRKVVAAKAANKKSKKSPIKIFRKIKFLVGEYYRDEIKEEIVSAIKGHGGTIVTKPSQHVSFLVQAWGDDEIDERLERCCELGIVGVPFKYLQDCIAAETLTHFHLWCMQRSGARPSPYLNPMVSLSLGHTVPEAGKHAKRGCVLGEPDWQSREREELNQSLHEHQEQCWPSLMDDDNRSVVYVLPFESMAVTSRGGKKSNKLKTKGTKGRKGSAKSGANVGILEQMPSFESTDKSLLSAFTAFIAAYFCCEVKLLKKVPLKISTTAASSLNISIECKHAVVEGVGEAQLLSVLDLLDVAATKLPK
jgi:hypothetical protein